MNVWCSIAAKTIVVALIISASTTSATSVDPIFMPQATPIDNGPMLPPSKAVSFRHLGTAYCLEQGRPSFLMSREDTERLRSRNGVAVIGDQDGLDKAWSDAFSTQTSNVLPAPNLDFTNEYVLVLSSFWEMLPNSKPVILPPPSEALFSDERELLMLDDVRELSGDDAGGHVHCPTIFLVFKRANRPSEVLYNGVYFDVRPSKGRAKPSSEP